MRKMLHCAATLLMLACVLAATPAFAGPTFTDGNFNLSDNGPLQQWLSGVGMSGSVQQSSFGNPGTSAEFMLNFAGTGDLEEGYQGLIPNGWSYDPGNQGVLTSIDFSQDKYIHTAADIALTGSNIRMLMLHSRGVLRNSCLPASGDSGVFSHAYPALTSRATIVPPFGLCREITRLEGIGYLVVSSLVSCKFVYQSAVTFDFRLSAQSRRHVFRGRLKPCPDTGL